MGQHNDLRDLSDPAFLEIVEAVSREQRRRALARAHDALVREARRRLKRLRGEGPHAQERKP